MTAHPETEWCSWVCGQAMDRSWVFDAITFPLCQRCTGIYAGAAVAAVIYCCLRWQPDRRSALINLWFLFQIVPSGLKLFPDSPALRMLSGGLFGVGLVGLLCHHPALSWRFRGVGKAWKGIFASVVSVSLLVPLALSPLPGLGAVFHIMTGSGFILAVALMALNVVSLFGFGKLFSLIGKARGTFLVEEKT